MNKYTELFASAFNKDLLKAFPLSNLVDKVKVKEHTYITTNKIKNQTFICEFKELIPYIADSNLKSEYDFFIDYVESLVHKVYTNNYIYKCKLQDDFLKYIRKEIGKYLTSECVTTEDILLKLSFLINTLEITDHIFMKQKSQAIKNWITLEKIKNEEFTLQPTLVKKELKQKKEKKTIKGEM